MSALYIEFIIITSVINRNKLVATNVLVGGLLYALAVWDMLLVFYSTVKLKGSHFVVKTLLVLAGIYAVVTDLFIFVNPNLFGGGHYFIGNKFYVVYKHI